VAESFSLPAAGIAVVLLDIEGTTTPLSFVHDVLFPYARARVPSFLEQTIGADDEIQRIVAQLRNELPASGFQLPAGSRQSNGESRMPEAASRLEAGSQKREADIVGYVSWLMDRDRKSGPLKALQGRIWEQGYATGALKGVVYPDVPPAFVRWTAAGVRIGIFSSGSMLAQKLLFANSTAGDLSVFLCGYFDTAVGAKGEAGSYRRIVLALDVAPSRVLFISDVIKELDAAREAGVQTLLAVRPPAHAPSASTHAAVESFDSIVAS
jgi:enolase-phosphatase E1